MDKVKEFAPLSPERSAKLQSSSLGKLALRRFLRSRAASFASVILLLVLGAAIFADGLAPYSYTQINRSELLKAPSLDHYFGTDELGRDIFSRVMHGSRASLQVMMISISLSLLFGVPIGLLAGYFGGRLEDLIMRIMDAWMAFPPLILALVMVAALGPSLTNTMIAIAIINVPAFVRLVRAETLRIREMDYIMVAHSLGCSHLRIIAYHIAPGTVGTITVHASIRAASAIITESSLSFLGLGVQPPQPSWGSMISVGVTYWQHAWWMSFCPGLAIFVTVLALNFLGDALRDTFDTRLSKD